MIQIISIGWFWGIFLDVFILKRGVSCTSYINRFWVFFDKCITTWEGMWGMDMYMIVFVIALVATDEYGDDEELKDGKEHHEQAEH